MHYVHICAFAHACDFHLIIMDVDRTSMEQKYKKELIEYYLAMQRSCSMIDSSTLHPPPKMENFPTRVRLLIKVIFSWFVPKQIN